MAYAGDDLEAIFDELEKIDHNSHADIVMRKGMVAQNHGLEMRLENAVTHSHSKTHRFGCHNRRKVPPITLAKINF